MSEIKRFPKRFYWGAATASYQVEGGNDNSDWAKAAQEKKIPVCGDACDHYNRYEEDFDIAKSLGHNAHRLSLEWARIEPKEGQFDPEAILHYRKVLQALKDRNMTPFITIWHWTLPLWLSESGGVERKDFPKVFARYSAHVVAELGDLADHFSTINEPYSTIINGWVRGTFPPFHRFPLISLIPIPSDKELSHNAVRDWMGIVKFYSLANILAQAHKEAYVAIKSVQPDAKVSLVFQVHVFKDHGNPFYELIARFQMWNMTHRFLKRVINHCDRIGLNYYFTTDLGRHVDYPKTDMGWDRRPDGIYDALRELKRYNKPIYVAECGCADEHDAFRSDYIKDTVLGIHRALQEGIDVRGFMYWSLLDNYEWAHGFGKRFGLVEVDYKTQKRTIRPSAQVYKQICLTNSVE